MIPSPNRRDQSPALGKNPHASTHSIRRKTSQLEQGTSLIRGYTVSSTYFVRGSHPIKTKSISFFILGFKHCSSVCRDSRLLVSDLDARVRGALVTEDRAHLGEAVGVLEEDNVTLVFDKLQETDVKSVLICKKAKRYEPCTPCTRGRLQTNRRERLRGESCHWHGVSS